MTTKQMCVKGLAPTCISALRICHDRCVYDGCEMQGTASCAPSQQRRKAADGFGSPGAFSPQNAHSQHKRSTESSVPWRRQWENTINTIKRDFNVLKMELYECAGILWYMIETLARAFLAAVMPKVAALCQKAYDGWNIIKFVGINVVTVVMAKVTALCERACITWNFIKRRRNDVIYVVGMALIIVVFGYVLRTLSFVKKSNIQQNDKLDQVLQQNEVLKIQNIQLNHSLYQVLQQNEVLKIQDRVMLDMMLKAINETEDLRKHVKECNQRTDNGWKIIALMMFAFLAIAAVVVIWVVASMLFKIRQENRSLEESERERQLQDVCQEKLNRNCWRTSRNSRDHIRSN